MMGTLKLRVAAAEPDGLDPPIRAALAVLGKAHAYSRDVNRVPWEFAVEIPRLLALGLTACDLRWLVDKGYVRHAREVTEPDDEHRRFEPARNLAFSAQTCFIATDAGLSLAGEAWGTVPISAGAVGRASGAHGRLASGVVAKTGLSSSLLPPVRFIGCEGETGEASPRPHWDAQRRVLTVHGRVVKRYRVPSPCQEAILSAFEEDGWPARIDDPLSPLGDQCPKDRLRSTIKYLNSSQEERLVRFRGDGTGEGIVWELVAAGALRVVRGKPSRRHAA